MSLSKVTLFANIPIQNLRFFRFCESNRNQDRETNSSQRRGDRTGRGGVDEEHQGGLGRHVLSVHQQPTQAGEEDQGVHHRSCGYL